MWKSVYNHHSMIMHASPPLPPFPDSAVPRHRRQAERRAAPAAAAPAPKLPRRLATRDRTGGAPGKSPDAAATAESGAFWRSAAGADPLYRRRPAVPRHAAAVPGAVGTILSIYYRPPASQPICTSGAVIARCRPV